ncbi:MAG: AbrB/MazE/SpoVT family DNA-binding domain-containing protein [Thermofilaceae archaeon]
MQFVLKVGKKGVVVFPKALREGAGIREGGEVIAEVRDGAVIIKPLKPKVVNVDSRLVEKLLREEWELEEEKARRILEEVRSRH